MKPAKIFVIMALFLTPSIANAFPENNCAHAVHRKLTELGYAQASNSTQYDVYHANSQYFFKWNSADSWTPCEQNAYKGLISCGSIAKLKPSFDSYDIFSTSGEAFRTEERSSKIMKCLINRKPKNGIDNGIQGSIFSYDFSVISLNQFTARGIGNRTFFLRKDNLGVETPVLIGKPKF